MIFRKYLQVSILTARGRERRFEFSLAGLLHGFG
jgi:hypothetical protein